MSYEEEKPTDILDLGGHEARKKKLEANTREAEAEAAKRKAEEDAVIAEHPDLIK
jgi:hypothetical protein